jgi:hypothetical protein
MTDEQTESFMCSVVVAIYRVKIRDTYISNIEQHTSKKMRRKTIKRRKKDLHCLQLVID